MIEYLTGKVIDKEDNTITLEVNNVGLRVYATKQLTEKCKSNQTIKIFTHLSFTEAGLFIYGFASKQERATFEKLIKVKGVGPRLAIAIISYIGVERLIKAIQNGDIQALSDVPGVGKKLALRIYAELKESIAKPTISDYNLIIKGNKIYENVQNALISLGFSKKSSTIAIKRVLDKLKGDSNETEIKEEELLKAALKELGDIGD